MKEEEEMEKEKENENKEEKEREEKNNKKNKNKQNCFSAPVHRPTLEHTQTSNKWAPVLRGGGGGYSSGGGRLGVTPATPLPLGAGFRMSGSPTPLLIRLQSMHGIDMTSFSCYSLSSCNFSTVGRNSTLDPQGSSVECKTLPIYKSLLSIQKAHSSVSPFILDLGVRRG